MIRLMLVHVLHLRWMAHGWRRLNRILLMILVTDRLLLNGRWINHVRHRCILPLLLVLQDTIGEEMSVNANVRVQLIIFLSSHDCFEREKERERVRDVRKKET